MANELENIQAQPALMPAPSDPEEDVSGQVGPLPDANTATPIPTEGMPDSAAGIDPTSGAPVDPQLAQLQALLATPQQSLQKVGQTVNTSTSRTKSPEVAANLKQLQDLDSQNQVLTAQQQNAAEDMAKVSAAKAEEEAAQLKTVRDSYAAAQAKAISDYQSTVAARDAKAAELATATPETFWGSKGTSDKIAAALSVGLGSIGQSLSGSGQNVGMMLINRQMDEFKHNQDRQYEAKVKEIDTMNTSLQNKQYLLSQLQVDKDSQLMGAHEQVNGMFARAQEMAKLPAVQALIGKQALQFSQQTQQLQMKQNATYEAQSQRSVTEDTLKMVADSNSKEGIKAKADVRKEYDKQIGDLAKTRTIVAEALKVLKDPNKTRDDKLHAGQGILQSLEAGGGRIPIAVIHELKGELDTSYDAILHGAKMGGGAGAVLGGGLGAVGGGVGAIPGAAIGGTLGGIGGVAAAALSEHGRPGGIRFSPNIDGFTDRVQDTLNRLDGGLRRQTRLKELVERGITVPQANMLIDHEEAQGGHP